jgi:hypothetical protein
MRNAGIISLAILFVMAGGAIGNCDVEIVPEHPTSFDIVAITLGGEWGDTCIPNASAISVEGNDIYFDVIWDYPPDIICAYMITPWELTEFVGPLPCGTYTIYARVVGYPGAPGYEPVGEFTVTATVYYVDAVAGNDLNDGLSPETAFATIQAAINTCNNGDVIIVAPGEYQEMINFLGKNITVTSTNPSDSQIVRNTIIEGSSNPSDYRAVIFGGTENESCTLTGFNIRATVAGNHTQAMIDHCLLEGARTYCGTIIGNFDGRISNCLIGPPLVMEQCFVPGYTLSECHGMIENCTIIGSARIGGGASATIQNCIFYKDGLYQHIITLLSGASLNISYSDLYESIDPIELKDSNCIVNWGPGNINLDPCFVQLGVWDFNEPITYYPGDFHLKSQAGRCNPNSQSWVTDANTSPCIDAGNPGCPLGDEPSDANNVRINMGAYGGTAEASKTPADWRSIADLTNDWVVDINDLGVFVSYWLDSGECIPSDLNRNQLVNFVDYAIFARQWPGAIAEPGIEFEISPCDSGLSATGQSDKTRFTVTVEGRYIHFEDMMVANCCPDKLELQMTVEGNLIMIHEVEYLTIPCDCICNYPVTATLGPFEPGTYTLEVYQNGFIGSTTVTIE